MGNAVSAENKIRYGLKNVYAALVDESDPTSIVYGTPHRIYGAVTWTGKSKFERTAIAADDDPEYAVIEDNQGYDGELELEILDDFIQKDVLGMVTDKNGVLVETANMKTTPVALMFEFDGDVKKTRHVLYRCRVSKPDEESSTRGEKVENKTTKLTISCTAAKDTEYIKACAKQGQTPYESWFKEVYLPELTEASNVSVQSASGTSSKSTSTTAKATN